MVSVKKITDTALIDAAVVIIFLAPDEEKAIFRSQIAQKFRFQPFAPTLGTTGSFYMPLHTLQQVTLGFEILGDHELISTMSANRIKIAG